MRLPPLRRCHEAADVAAETTIRAAERARRFGTDAVESTWRYLTSTEATRKLPPPRSHRTKHHTRYAHTGGVLSL